MELITKSYESGVPELWSVEKSIHQCSITPVLPNLLKLKVHEIIGEIEKWPKYFPPEAAQFILTLELGGLKGFSQGWQDASSLPSINQLF